MLDERAQVREADFFEHSARLVEVFADIAAVCVRAVTYLSSAEFKISFDNISLRRHLVMEVDLERFASCDDAFEDCVDHVWEILVSEQFVARRRAVGNVAYVRDYVVRIGCVEAFENGFEISAIHSLFRFEKERHFEIHVVAVHAMHRVYHHVERIFRNGFLICFLCRLARIVTRLNAETKV